MGSGAVLEEKYAKEIALALDSARQGMTIHLNMEDAINTAKKENLDATKIVKIENNIVTVDLQGKGGYSYSFFNGFDFNGKTTRTYVNESAGDLVLILRDYK